MRTMASTANLHRAVDDLIAKLRDGGNAELAGVLDHRLHKVVWTSGSELLDELHTVLSKALQSPKAPVSEIRGVLEMIDAARLR
jgi:hypothetical protein